MRRSESLSLPLFPPDGLASAAPPTSATPTLVLLPAVADARRAELEELVASVNRYAADVRAEATRRGYARDFEAFAAWCAFYGLEALPATPATVAAYLAARAREGRRPSTIERALAGIAYAHRERGCPWPRTEPTVARVMRGIRRCHGVAPAQKAAVSDEDLAAMVAVVGDDLVGRRDCAILTLGWLGAFRRSELAALDVEDLVKVPEGLLVRVRRAKGDQEGRGADKAIPYAARETVCAVRALEAWLAAAGIASGPVFRAVVGSDRLRPEPLSDRTVARIVQRAAAAAGLDATKIAAHSLRAGFITTAAKRGKRLDEIMRQTHQTTERVVLRYIRSVGAFENNAAVGLV